ncbi:TetR/AcrR family transcriptional regulator [Conyzicola sp.]|uniref:TetR/AcrR family transcriptional regulator n=1 Tax=Conyzicola sp. TaxID=1969404 RepID=UPI003989051A
MTRMSAADRRPALLEAAFRVIAAEGVHGATTRAIVAEADMSLASFHYAFTSRDEMMHELIAHVIENQAVAAFESLRFGADLRTAVRDGLRAFFEVVTADPAHEQTMFELVQYSLRTPELAALPRKQYSGYRLAVGGLLETAAADTGMVWMLPLDDVARMVVALTDGITVAWLADRDSAAASRVIEFAATSIAALAQPAHSSTPVVTLPYPTTTTETP